MRMYLLLFIAATISNCNTSSSTSTSQGFDLIFDSVFKKDEPGGAVLIAKDGKIIYEKGFGIEDINTKKPITTQTLFNVGSISKTFVAFGILQLAKEKKLSIMTKFISISLTLLTAHLPKRSGSVICSLILQAYQTFEMLQETVYFI